MMNYAYQFFKPRGADYETLHDGQRIEDEYSPRMYTILPHDIKYIVFRWSVIIGRDKKNSWRIAKGLIVYL